MAPATTGAAAAQPVVRANTQYIRTPKQLKRALDAHEGHNRSTKAAKERFQKAEAQAFADKFRRRIELVVDSRFDDWVVIDSMFDLVRKAILKVQVDDEEFLHIFATKASKADPWKVRFSTMKTEDDPLAQDEEAYEEEVNQRMRGFGVLDDSQCGSFDKDGCNTDLPSCTLM